MRHSIRTTMLLAAAILSALALSIATWFAVDAGRDMGKHDACHLGLEFEVTSARTLKTSWLPPSATCEYAMPGKTYVVTESRWVVYLPVIPALGLSTALVAWTRRRQRPLPAAVVL